MNWFVYCLGQISANDRLRMEVPPFADMEQHPYGWLSLVPPLVAIVLAILTRRVLISLLVAVFVGAMILGFYAPPRAANYEPSGWQLVFDGAVSAWYDHLWPSLLHPDRMSVFVFTCLMGAIVGMVNRAAGMRGLISLLCSVTKSRAGVQVSTWLAGMLIFFDDYANTMLLGTTYRSLYDRMKISREKLAYIVDSTAAPVAGLAVVSTWIAGELSYINDGLAGVALQDPGNSPSAFQLFVASIPYRFYVLWALFFVLVSAVLRRDFGPMFRAERAARNRVSEGPIDDYLLSDDLDWKRLRVSRDVMQVEVSEAVATAYDPTLAPQQTPARSINAILPILVTVVAILGLMYQSGLRNREEADSFGKSTSPFMAQLQQWGEIFGATDSYGSLLWGSAIGLLFTWFWLGWQRIVPAAALGQAAARGAMHMVPALAILWLASTLSVMTSATPSDSYKQELAQAQAVAEAIAGIEKQGERFTSSNRTERVFETLRLHAFSEPVIVQTMAGQYSDPNQFRDEVLSRIADQAIGSGFYSRYLHQEGKQVDWNQYSQPRPSSETGTPETGTPETGTPETGTPETGGPEPGADAPVTSDGSAENTDTATNNDQTTDTQTTDTQKNDTQKNDTGEANQNKTENGADGPATVDQEAVKSETTDKQTSDKESATGESGQGQSKGQSENGATSDDGDPTLASVGPSPRRRQLTGIQRWPTRLLLQQDSETQAQPPKSDGSDAAENASDADDAGREARVQGATQDSATQDKVETQAATAGQGGRQGRGGGGGGGRGAGGGGWGGGPGGGGPGGGGPGGGGPGGGGRRWSRAGRYQRHGGRVCQRPGRPERERSVEVAGQRLGSPIRRYPTPVAHRSVPDQPPPAVGGHGAAGRWFDGASVRQVLADLDLRAGWVHGLCDGHQLGDDGHHHAVGPATGRQHAKHGRPDRSSVPHLPGDHRRGAGGGHLRRPLLADLRHHGLEFQRQRLFASSACLDADAVCLGRGRRFGSVRDLTRGLRCALVDLHDAWYRSSGPDHAVFRSQRRLA